MEKTDKTSRGIIRRSVKANRLNLDSLKISAISIVYCTLVVSGVVDVIDGLGALRMAV